MTWKEFARHLLSNNSCITFLAYIAIPLYAYILLEGLNVGNKTKDLSALVHTEGEIYQGCCLSRCSQRSSRSQGFSSQGWSEASRLGLLKNIISITKTVSVQFISVQFSCSVMSDSLWPRGLQHARPPCPSPTPRACSNSCPSSQWCHPAISSSVVPFSSCLQSFPASQFILWKLVCPWQWITTFLCISEVVKNLYWN